MTPLLEKRGKKKKVVPPPGPVPTSLLMPSGFQHDMFWRGLRASAGFHAGLVIVAILLSLTLAREPKKFIPSIRVDLVALPDAKKADLDKMQPSDYEDLSAKLKESTKGTKELLEAQKKIPDPKPAEPAEDVMALKKKEKAEPKNRKKDLKSALDRIKALADLESETESEKKGRQKKYVAKGNELSKGSSSSGVVSDQADQFFSGLQSKIRNNWNLPVWLSKQNLNATVVIFLDRSGYVSNSIIAKSSGNKQFDDYCLKTVRMAQPFGAPPDDVVQEGITLGFPL